MDPTLEQSQAYCHELMRKAARNFYFGMSLLPSEKRSAMFALYAFMRQIDDLADDGVDAGVALPEIERQLQQWRTLTHAALAGKSQDHPMFPAFVQASRQFGIPADLYDAAIDGQIQDLHQLHYATFDELKRYCYRVASTVGIAAIYIWGFKDPNAIALADDRGVAFQLTNILRDLREDHARGRVYLPQEDLDRFGVDLDSVMRGGDTAAFAQLMRFQIQRAQGFYDSSRPLEGLIAPDSRATLGIMTGIYHGILDRIAADPLAVLRGKVGLSSLAKLAHVAKGLWLDRKLRFLGGA